MHQDVWYDYKVDLTEVGSRSQINADDILECTLQFALAAQILFARVARRGTAYAHCTFLSCLAYKAVRTGN